MHAACKCEEDLDGSFGVWSGDEVRDGGRERFCFADWEFGPSEERDDWQHDLERFDVVAQRRGELRW
eukprot:530671-Pleurochrysis_carterae.AAC.1